MKHIRKDDTVKVVAGKDKGKEGKVIKVYPSKNRAIVQGINFVKKHQRRTREDQQGGVVQMEAPINIDNLMLVCSKCNKTIRPKIKILSDGTKVKSCRKCGENL